MKYTYIRVTRTQKVTITEYVDVPVRHEDDASDATVSARAETLVEAQIGAGHNIDWVLVSKEEGRSWETNITAAKSPEQPAVPVG